MKPIHYMDVVRRISSFVLQLHSHYAANFGAALPSRTWPGSRNFPLSMILRSDGPVGVSAARAPSGAQTCQYASNGIWGTAVACCKVGQCCFSTPLGQSVKILSLNCCTVIPPIAKLSTESGFVTTSKETLFSGTLPGTSIGPMSPCVCLSRMCKSSDMTRNWVKLQTSN